MLIEKMPEVLQWGDDRNVLTRVHDAYVSLLSERLGYILGMLQKSAHGSAQLRDLVLGLPDDGLQRLLTAPETCYRLLWTPQHTPESLHDFLESSALAEARRLNESVELKGEVWTALGDARFRPGEEPWYAPSIPGMSPLDFDSPHACFLDLEGRILPRLPQPRLPLEGQERQVSLKRLQSAHNAIQQTSALVSGFVNLFNKVLILQRDPDLPTTMTSGSAAQYIGRSVLANPQLESVDVVEVVEGIVHEAIHSLLYMQEQQKAWVYTQDLYGPTIRTVSPWTGTPLPLRPYLQASFVWYGLFHFWALTIQSDTLNRRRVRERMHRAAIGFLRTPLLKQISQHTRDICPDLLDAVQTLQRNIKQAFT
jgi:hypothetical protein